MDRYIIIDDLVSPSDAQDFIALIDSLDRRKRHEIQDIISMPKVSERLWKKIESKLRNTHLDLIRREVDGATKTFKLVGLSDYVTVSRHHTAIGIHKDAEGKTKYKNVKDNGLYCFYKLVIYLNTVCSKGCCSGGTALYDDNKRKVAVCRAKVGRALIFDIRDYHSGVRIHRGKTKYLIGFRLLYREVGDRMGMRRDVYL